MLRYTFYMATAKYLCWLNHSLFLLYLSHIREIVLWQAIIIVMTHNFMDRALQHNIKYDFTDVSWSTVVFRFYIHVAVNKAEGLAVSTISIFLEWYAHIIVYAAWHVTYPPIADSDLQDTMFLRRVSIRLSHTLWMS